MSSNISCGMSDLCVNAAGADRAPPPDPRRTAGVVFVHPPDAAVTPCDGGCAAAAGGSCGVAHSSGGCYFWRADYIMSRDGFADPAACVHACT